MEDILKSLNPQQLQAVTAPGGATLVLAGPGSGKTRVLTYRIAYLINRMGVLPYNILAVTFTNKAAREMEARVQRILGDNVTGIWLGTFHAICGRILRREADHLPVDRNYVIYDEGDQESLIKAIIKEMRLNDKLFSPRSVLGAISNAKNELILPEHYVVSSFKDEKIRDIYRLYQQRLVKCNAVDFDDMLLYTSHLMEANPDVCERYARRFAHVLVDEFQDTNLAQYNLLMHLCSFHKNLFAVGDEDQSIYRWRGADYRNIIRFEKKFPSVTKILLEQNYRSTQNILDAAVAVIDRNKHRTHKALFSELGSGEKIILYEAADDRQEANYVVDTIGNLIRNQSASEGDFAIMYRTNAQSRLLEEEFRRAKMNYRLVGAQRFYGRREVKDIIAFLRLIYNPQDEVSLVRVINTPPRGIGDKSVERLRAHAAQNDTSAASILIDLAKGDASPHWAAFGTAARRLAEFGYLLNAWCSLAAEDLPTAVFDRVVQDIDYKTFIDDQSEEGQDRWGNVLELRQALVEYDDKGLAEFLESMALVGDQDTLPEEVNAPTMLTLHAAKGLEFNQVFIVGLDEYLLPHSRSRDDEEAMAEERRLFYVGITRARQKLYLVRSERRRSPYGNYDASDPSRFLADLPDDLLRKNVRSWQTAKSSSTSASSYRWEASSSAKPASKPAKTVNQQYQAGMRVQHPFYGTGTVKKSMIELGDETVEIQFDQHGLKCLVASMAQLKTLS